MESITRSGLPRVHIELATHDRVVQLNRHLTPVIEVEVPSNLPEITRPLPLPFAPSFPLSLQPQSSPPIQDYISISSTSPPEQSPISSSPSAQPQNTSNCQLQHLNYNEYVFCCLRENIHPNDVDNYWINYYTEESVYARNTRRRTGVR